jgi:hypothetical protein
MMKRSLASASLLLIGAAPEPPVLLPLDPLFFAEDSCLAPAFDGAGCPERGRAGDDRPTASAALLAPDRPDPAPLLDFDVSVLREGPEVTLSG